MSLRCLSRRRPRSLCRWTRTGSTLGPPKATRNGSSFWRKPGTRRRRPAPWRAAAACSRADVLYVYTPSGSTARRRRRRPARRATHALRRLQPGGAPPSFWRLDRLADHVGARLRPRLAAEPVSADDPITGPASPPSASDGYHRVVPPDSLSGSPGGHSASDPQAQTASGPPAAPPLLPLFFHGARMPRQHLSDGIRELATAKSCAVV